MSSFQSTGNPVINHIYTSDPTAIVHDDTLYLYTGHDEAPVGTEDYVMNDWLCFSSQDLVDWKEYPSPLKATDFQWSPGGAYATKMIANNGLFYWYAAVKYKQQGTAIGAAVSSQPTTGFKDAIGAPLISPSDLPANNNEKANLDPTVLIDDDGQVYIFWGNGICYFAKLNGNMISLDSEIKQVDLPGFEEGAHIHKRNGWYYLSYGYGMPEKVAYAMSRNINGPWIYKGILNEIAGNCQTNRPCIIEFKGRSYFIYHNGALKNGGSHRRSVCIDFLNYNEDDSIERVVMTTEGVFQSQKSKIKSQK